MEREMRMCGGAVASAGASVYGAVTQKEEKGERRNDAGGRGEEAGKQRNSAKQYK